MQIHRRDGCTEVVQAVDRWGDDHVRAVHSNKIEKIRCCWYCHRKQSKLGYRQTKKEKWITSLVDWLYAVSFLRSMSKETESTAIERQWWWKFAHVTDCNDRVRQWLTHCVLSNMIQGSAFVYLSKRRHRLCSNVIFFNNFRMTLNSIAWTNIIRFLVFYIQL